MEYVNEAIEHTPTLVEVYACKARIYKHVWKLSWVVMLSTVKWEKIGVKGKLLYTTWKIVTRMKEEMIQ